MKKARKWIIGALLALAAAAGAFAYWKTSQKAPVVVLVRAREIQQTIVSSGQIMSPAEVRLDALITSTVKEIRKREGDPVRAGEVIMSLDDSDLAVAVTQAEANLAQARAGKGILRRTTLPRASEALDELRANLGQARSELERQRRLFAAGVTASSALEQAQRAVRVYESQQNAALVQVEAASASGSSSLSASATIAVAEAQLAAVRLNQSRALVLAPMDGVISARMVEVGEVVRPGSPLVVLTAEGKTRVVLEPDERNLALLAVGQHAVVSAEAFADKSFDATVAYIAPAVDPARGTIEVRLDVREPPPYLRPNMTVAVELKIASRTQALSLPLSAVQDSATTHPWVAVLDAKQKLTRRDVQLGLRGDEWVEITRGLKAGERVALDAPPTLSPVEP